MWYWIKSPAGELNDYNLAELKLALSESKVQPGWMGRRHDEQQWFPVQSLVEQDEGEDDNEPEHDQPPAKYLSLACGKCGKNLCIQLPLEETTYPCPECGLAYKSTRVSADPLTYVLMPERL